MGNREIEDSLEKLDKLTQEEARMASAEQLKMTHIVDGKVTGVDDRVRSVEGQVEGVRSDVQDVGVEVQDVGNRVQDVDDRVQDVGDKIQDVGDRVQGIDSNIRAVDDKLDHAHRSLSFQTLIVIPRAHTTSQGTSSEIVFYDGFRPQIHPPIITTHAKLIMAVQLNGFSKEEIGRAHV